MTTLDDVVNRLRAELLEVPGLRLTSGQVQRLCGVEKTLCQSVMAGGQPCAPSLGSLPSIRSQLLFQGQVPATR